MDREGDVKLNLEDCAVGDRGDGEWRVDGRADLDTGRVPPGTCIFSNFSRKLAMSSFSVGAEMGVSSFDGLDESEAIEYALREVKTYLVSRSISSLTEFERVLLCSEGIGGSWRPLVENFRRETSCPDVDIEKRRRKMCVMKVTKV